MAALTNVGVERRDQRLADPVVIHLHRGGFAGVSGPHQPCAAKDGQDARIPVRQIGSRVRIDLEQRLALRRPRISSRCADSSGERATAVAAARSRARAGSADDDRSVSPSPPCRYATSS